MGATTVGEFLTNFVWMLVNVLQFAIIVRALMSWFNPSPENPIVKLVIGITEPVLEPLRRIVPRIGMIDITPIVAIILLSLVESLLRQVIRGM